MKHCLNCYRMLPNTARTCHYCGAEQAEKKALPGKQVLRCPRCLSYLYSEKDGCQTCGYMPGSGKTVEPLFIVISLLLLGAFILWQLGFLPGIPHGGKAAQRITAETQPVSIIIPTIPDEGQAAVPPAAERNSETPAAFTAKPAPLTGETGSQETVLPSVTETATENPPEQFFCGQQANRLREGMYGKIVSGGNASKIRRQPSTGSEMVTVFNADQEFIVLADKPVCDEGYLWIKIRILPDQQEGWTVESDAENYWLIEKNVTPIPPAND